MKELLINTMPFEYTPAMLTESSSNGHLRVSGVLQRADTKNENKRIYPHEILAREVERYNNEFVKHRRAIGSLDHPNSEIVELKTVSHNIVEMHWEGNDLVGTIEVLPTPNGNILANLLKAGILVGISSRGMGSVKHDVHESADIVQDDFNLICFDMVSTPSTQGAYMYRDDVPLNESVNRTLSAGYNSNNEYTSKYNSNLDIAYRNIEHVVQNILTYFNPKQ